MGVILCAQTVLDTEKGSRGRLGGRGKWEVAKVKASAVVGGTLDFALEISSGSGEAGSGEKGEDPAHDNTSRTFRSPQPPPRSAHRPTTPHRRPSQRRPLPCFKTLALLLQIDTMLKFWPSTPADLTPRADPNGRERPNPFDQLPSASSPSAASTPPLLSSSTPTTTLGPLTPTGALPSYHHQLLGTPHHLLSPSISAANGSDPVPHSNPQMPLTPGGASSFAAPTTSLSLHAPEFNMQQPPPPKRTQTATKQAQQTPLPNPSSSTKPDHKLPLSKLQPSGIAKSASSSSSSSANGSPSSVSSHHSTANGVPGGPSRGQIHVKLIQARGLNVRSSKARPYVVVQFEQNEFVSRDPTDETDKEVKGVATNLSRNSSSTALSTLPSSSNALSALGVINEKMNARVSGRSSTSTSAKTSRDHTPSSSVSSNKSGVSSLFGTRIQAHNPVWKHEVSL